jgi:hypothetical protein
MGKNIFLFFIIIVMVLSFSFNSLGCSGGKGPLGPLHSLSCAQPPPLSVTITPDPGVENQPVIIKISNISDKKLVEIQILDSASKRIRYYSDYDVSSPDRVGPVPQYSNKELTLTETFKTGNPGQWKLICKDLGGQTLNLTFNMAAAK